MTNLEVLLKSSVDGDTETIFSGEKESCLIFLRAFVLGLAETGFYKVSLNQENHKVLLESDDPQAPTFVIWIGCPIPPAAYTVKRT